MTRRQIEKALPFWKSLLALEDWTITVRQGRAEEMNSENVGECEGLNYFSPEEMESNILLARGTGEDTLVHELIHLVVDGDKPGVGKYNHLHERAINRLAKALMKLKGMIEE